MYGPLVIAYLFLGGTAAGCLFSMSLWSLIANRKLRAARGASRSASAALRRYVQSFASLQRRVYVLCLVLLVMAVLFLFWDLGTPENVLLVFLRARATVLTFGAACLTVEIALAVLLVCATVLRFRLLQGRARHVIEVLACFFSVATMSYTGVFFLGSIGIAFWSSPAIIGLFAFSSLSCGLASMLLVVYFLQDQALLLRAARPLQKWHLVCLAGEAVFLALFIIAAFNNPDAADAVSILLSPEILPTGSIGVIMFGIIIPACSEIYALSKQGHRTIPASDAICLTGGLILRWCIIVCGVH